MLNLVQNNTFIIKNAKVICPSSGINEVLDIRIKNGVIVELAKNIAEDGFNFTNMTVIPGLIDMHCHLREPGFETKETIKSGIMSAINGGYCAICPMANTNPTIDSTAAVRFEQEKANCVQSNFLYPIAAISKGLLGEEITDISALRQSGAIAFSDDGKPIKNLKLLEKALLTNELIISHAEDSKLLTHPDSEAICVERELKILQKTGGRIHFAHISTKKAIDLIRKAKENKLNVTCETAPHYFTFTDADVTKDGRFKMNPPLRKKEDSEAVIEGLKDGTIDCIATDHAPHTIEEKLMPFKKAPFGIVGFETALPASLKLVHEGHLSMNTLIEKLSLNPAKILGLNDYGKIKIGQLANLTIIDTDSKYIVRAENFLTKAKITPFEGMQFKGKNIATICSGKLYANRTQREI